MFRDKWSKRGMGSKNSITTRRLQESKSSSLRLVVALIICTLGCGLLIWNEVLQQILIFVNHWAILCQLNTPIYQYHLRFFLKFGILILGTNTKKNNYF